jgi:DNA-directed RNA polymerase specialized sigma24 family protein
VNGPVHFATTRWSQVAAAGSGARPALAWLCNAYWEPLQAHVRRRGFTTVDADDQTQEFMLKVVQGGIIERADKGRGRFRTFLLACLDHHLMHAHERAAAAKRGGGITHVGADPPAAERDAEAAFDRDWALAVLARAGDRLRAQGGDAGRHQALARLLTGGDAASYAHAAAELGMEPGAVRVAVHRLRVRFAACLRDEVAETLSDVSPATIDAEIGDLLAALRAAGV